MNDSLLLKIKNKMNNIFFIEILCGDIEIETVKHENDFIINVLNKNVLLCSVLSHASGGVVFESHAPYYNINLTSLNDMYLEMENFKEVF